MVRFCENRILHIDQCSSASSSSFLCPGGQQREIIVSKSDTKVLITDFNPSKDYVVSVIAVSGTAQSRPLHGRYKGKHSFPFFFFFCINIPYLGIVLISISIEEEFCLRGDEFSLQLKEVRMRAKARLSPKGRQAQLHLLRLPTRSLEVGQMHTNALSRRRGGSHRRTHVKEVF